MTTRQVLTVPDSRSIVIYQNSAEIISKYTTKFPMQLLLIDGFIGESILLTDNNGNVIQHNYLDCPNTVSSLVIKNGVEYQGFIQKECGSSVILKQDNTTVRINCPDSITIGKQSKILNIPNQDSPFTIRYIVDNICFRPIIYLNISGGKIFASLIAQVNNKTDTLFTGTNIEFRPTFLSNTERCIKCSDRRGYLSRFEESIYSNIRGDFIDDTHGIFSPTIGEKFGGVVGDLLNGVSTIVLDKKEIISKPVLTVNNNNQVTSGIEFVSPWNLGNFILNVYQDDILILSTVYDSITLDGRIVVNTEIMKGLRIIPAFTRQDKIQALTFNIENNTGNEHLVRYIFKPEKGQKVTGSCASSIIIDGDVIVEIPVSKEMEQIYTCEVVYE